METKNTDDKVLKELEDLSFDHHFLVSPHSPGGGGLALLWTNEVSISILSSSHNFIDTSLVWDQLSLLGAARTPQETRVRVKDTLGIANEGGVGKYLGLPELFTGKKRDLFTSIVDRITCKAASWSTRRLSAAAKLTMLKSVLAPIPNHAMPFGPPREMKKNLVVADLLTHGSHDWNQARVELIFPEVTHLILQIKPSSLNAEDAF
ncbi:BnaC06g41330D [Brassica napus]|uniref:BnaC06g41330D protein n=1 Tax=Brassica napus TaxID=3708 RepID=A0A078IWP7_BRANA|nr:BnaC06g41330D [Brassica napus]